jgi:transposase
MNKEKQRKAIAEACGFKCSEDSDELGQLVAEFTPDYLHDLNAMHQAEKVLTKNKSMEYAFRLADSWILNGEDKQPDLVRGFCATAAERAEAFLKTIGKWEDEA